MSHTETIPPSEAARLASQEAPVIVVPTEPAPPAPAPTVGIGETGDGLVVLRVGDTGVRFTPEQAIAAGRDLFQRGERLKRARRKALAKRVGRDEAKRIEKAEG